MLIPVAGLITSFRTADNAALCVIPQYAANPDGQHHRIQHGQRKRGITGKPRAVVEGSQFPVFRVEVRLLLQIHHQEARGTDAKTPRGAPLPETQILRMCQPAKSRAARCMANRASGGRYSGTLLPVPTAQPPREEERSSIARARR